MDGQRFSEPELKRAIAFIDGQNLFHAAREAFGHVYPSFDVLALARRLCSMQGWRPVQTRFYTGVPDPDDDRFWHGFWAAKLLHMNRQGIHVFRRPLRYRNRSIRMPDGSIHTFMAGEEKGIDVRSWGRDLRGGGSRRPCTPFTVHDATGYSPTCDALGSRRRAGMATPRCVARPRSTSRTPACRRSRRPRQ